MKKITQDEAWKMIKEGISGSMIVKVQGDGVDWRIHLKSKQYISIGSPDGYVGGHELIKDGVIGEEIEYVKEVNFGEWEIKFNNGKTHAIYDSGHVFDTLYDEKE